MGIVTAKYDGKCKTCKALIKTGDKVYVKKGEQPLCVKCAPPDAKVLKDFPKATLTTWDHFAIAAIAPSALGSHSVNELTKKAAGVADAMMKERANRGIK